MFDLWWWPLHPVVSEVWFAKSIKTNKKQFKLASLAPNRGVARQSKVPVKSLFHVDDNQDSDDESTDVRLEKQLDLVEDAETSGTLSEEQRLDRLRHVCSGSACNDCCGPQNAQPTVSISEESISNRIVERESGQNKEVRGTLSNSNVKKTTNIQQFSIPGKIINFVGKSPGLLYIRGRWEWAGARW